MRLYIKYTLVICILSMVTLFTIYAIDKIRKSREVDQKMLKVPNLTLLSLDQSVVSLTDFYQNNLIVILFNTDCEFCHNQIKEMSNRIELFKNSRLIFISLESEQKLRRFEMDFQLSKRPNVLIGRVDQEDFYKFFGHVSFPTTYIFNGNGLQKKKFRGEVSVEVLSNYLSDDPL